VTPVHRSANSISDEPGHTVCRYSKDTNLVGSCLCTALMTSDSDPSTSTTLPSFRTIKRLPCRGMHCHRQLASALQAVSRTNVPVSGHGDSPVLKLLLNHSAPYYCSKITCSCCILFFPTAQYNEFQVQRQARSRVLPTPNQHLMDPQAWAYSGP
jgi:hypothetical protein